MNIHAGLIAIYHQGAWQGVLIQGPSGAGKSDLALRAIAAGARLVSDDRTHLWVSGGGLFGACPAAIAGLIEVRGVGIVPQPTRPFAQLRLIVRALTPEQEAERLPEAASQTLMGIDLPVVSLRPFEASAQQKVFAALSLLGGGR
jgi:serine kinase of HPr protein (carbohydrate metabolism regulator)